MKDYDSTASKYALSADKSYNEWAVRFLEELYYAPEDHRVALVVEHFNKVHRRGCDSITSKHEAAVAAAYEDGKENGWKHELESDPNWIKNKVNQKSSIKRCKVPPNCS